MFIIITFVFIFRSNIFYLFSIINTNTKKTNDNLITENNILKRENEYLNQELKSLSNLTSYANYDYELTRMSYRLSYTDNEICILNTKGII